MAETARGLGHEYLALTDHSPRLKVANGLSADRLRRQLDVVASLNADLAPFRILTGIEVDILDDGTLDQDPDLLERLDVVVASVHSKLRMDRVAMTKRMVAAIANPRVNILGHCTGRIVMVERGGLRPESEFDAALVFDACAAYDVAVEINSRPERLDPPKACCASPSSRLPLLDRLRRPRPGPARLAALRLRTSRPVRGPRVPDRQHPPGRRPPHLDARQTLTALSR